MGISYTSTAVVCIFGEQSRDVWTMVLKVLAAGGCEYRGAEPGRHRRLWHAAHDRVRSAARDALVLKEAGFSAMLTDVDGAARCRTLPGLYVQGDASAG